MSAKAALTIIGLTMVIQGLSFYFLADPITNSMFPEAGNEAIEVGIVMRQLLGGGSLFIGIILFLARTNVNSAAKRILFGASFGFLILIVILLHISFVYENVNVPILPLIIFAIFSLISFIYGESGLRDRR